MDARDKGSSSEGKFREGAEGDGEFASAPGKRNLGAFLGEGSFGAFFSGALSSVFSESGLSLMTNFLCDCWQLDEVLSMLRSKGAYDLKNW